MSSPTWIFLPETVGILTRLVPQFDTIWQLITIILNPTSDRRHGRYGRYGRYHAYSRVKFVTQRYQRYVTLFESFEKKVKNINLQ